MSNLFKIGLTPEDIANVKLRQVYKSEKMDQFNVPAVNCRLTSEFYGDLKFEKLYEDRPYTFTSLVTSIDGRIAYSDKPEGPLIAKLNKYDPVGATGDWMILNLLRTAADGIIVGGGTLAAEADFTGHIFYQEMEDSRLQAGKPEVPWNIITSLDGTDIPYGHILFNEPEIPVMISTSVKGLDAVKANIKNEYTVIGPFRSKEDVDQADLTGCMSTRGKVLVLITGADVPDAHVTMYALKKIGFHKVLVETPSFAHYLVSQKLMDELFFNYSCVYLGGKALTIGQSGKEFTSTDHPHTRMLSIHSHSDHFFYFRHQLMYD